MGFSKFQLFILTVKTLASAIIIVLIFTPTKLTRGELETKFRIEKNFTGIHHSGRHLFCAISDEIESIAEQEIMSILGLPNDTIVGDRLQQFGRCRVQRRKTGGDLEECSCHPRPVLLLLCACAMVSKIVDFIRLCYANLAFREKNSLRKSSRSNVHRYSACFGALFWFTASVASLVLHLNLLEGDDEVWLPDRLYSQNYFQRPITWSVAVALACVCSICGSLEVIHLRRPSTNIGKPEDEWLGDEEAYPEDVQYRLTNFRVTEIKTNRSWP